MTAREALDRAMRLHREDQLAAAAAIYREILRSEPLNFDALNLLGSICLRQGRFDEALAVLGKALQINPRSLEAQMNLGYALSHLDRLEEAIASFRRAASIRPDFTEAHNSIAMISAALDRPEDAIAAWERAIETRPGSAELHNNLGAALSAFGRHEAAGASYRRAIDLQPGSAELHNNLGLALASLGHPEQAVEVYRRAIELAPEYGPAHNNLGVALSRLGHLDAAILSYRRALALAPDAADAHNNLGAALSKLDRHEEAAACYRRAIEIAPDFAEACNNLGNALSKLDRHEEATACYRRAIESDPNYAAAYDNLGALQVRNRGFDAAIASFRKALTINPELAQAHNGLAYALVQKGRPDEAIAHYERAIAIKPDYAEAHNNLGSALKMLGRVDAARQAIETAVRLEPGRVEFYASLAESKRFAAGDPHLAAMNQLARDIAALPDDAQMQLHFALGKAFADLAQFGKSFDHLLAGNTIKRRQTVYDEATVLGAFDRIRRVFTPELMHAKRGLGHPSAVPLFILGMPRSGSTLVEQILASHPAVFGAGELTDLVDIASHLAGPGGTLSDFPESIRDIPGPRLSELGANYLNRVCSLAPAATRITDKMPANFRFAGLIHLILPNARIIHLERDPLDICFSCFSILFGGDQPHTYDLGELGRYYRAYDALMAHWRSVLPPGIMLEVKYEEVVTDFERQARRIVAHCGLEWDDACLAFYETRRSVQTASMVQVRQPIYRSSIGRWQAYKDRLGPLLAALGLDPPRRS